MLGIETRQRQVSVGCVEEEGGAFEGDGGEVGAGAALEDGLELGGDALLASDVVVVLLDQPGVDLG